MRRWLTVPIVGTGARPQTARRPDVPTTVRGCSLVADGGSTALVLVDLRQAELDTLIARGDVVDHGDADARAARRSTVIAEAARLGVTLEPDGYRTD